MLSGTVLNFKKKFSEKQGQVIEHVAFFMAVAFSMAGTVKGPLDGSCRLSGKSAIGRGNPGIR